MDDPLAFLASFLLSPLLISAVALGLAWKPWRGEAVRASRATAWGAPLAVGLGYAAGHVGAHGWPPLALTLGVKQGLFYVAMAGVAVGLYEGARRPSLSTRALLSIAAPLYLLDFMRRNWWSTKETILWMGVLAAALFAGWCALDVLARRRSGASLPLAWCGACALGAGALHYSGSSTLGQSGGVLAVCLGVTGVVGLRRPELTLAGGGVTCLSLLYVGLIWAGRYAGELSAGATALLAVAPLLPWLVETPALRRRTKPLGRALLRIVLAALPAAGALWVEAARWQGSSSYY